MTTTRTPVRHYTTTVRDLQEGDRIDIKGVIGTVVQVYERDTVTIGYKVPKSMFINYLRDLSPTAVIDIYPTR